MVNLAEWEGALSATLFGGTDPRVYYLDRNNHINELAWLGMYWNWMDVTQVAGGNPALQESALSATVFGGTDLRVYYLDGGNINELAWLSTESKWSWRDVTQAAGGQPAVLSWGPGASALSATLFGGTDPRVYYLDRNNHINELAWLSTESKWSWRDVTQAAGGQPASSGTLSPLSATVFGGTDLRVYYLDRNNHINELAWLSTESKWSWRDVTQAAGGQPASSGTALSATLFGGTDPRVYYLDRNNHINELAWLSRESKWSWRDVTHDSGGQPAAWGCPLSATVLGNDPRVYYLDGNFQPHVNELAWLSTESKWSWRDVTQAAGGQNPPVGESALSATVFGGTDLRVYYPDGNSHINELAWHPTDSKWYWRDVTNDAGVLTSNRNAVLVNETGNTCNSLQNLIVRLEVTEDLITQGDTGFTLQLNATPQPGANCQGQPLTWLQYVIYITNNQAFYEIQYWSSTNHPWPGGYTPIANTTPWLPCWGNDYSMIEFGSTLSSNQLPAGSVMEIALTTDSNANVTGATFSITDPSGNVSKGPWSPPPGATFPLSAFTVNLVGPGNGSSCAFTSGKGLLTYSVSQSPLSVQDGGSSAACGDPSITGEASNAVYGAVTYTRTEGTVTQTLTLWPLSGP